MSQGLNVTEWRAVCVHIVDNFALNAFVTVKCCVSPDLLILLITEKATQSNKMWILTPLQPGGNFFVAVDIFMLA